MTLLNDLEDLSSDFAGDAGRFVPQAIALIEHRIQQHPQHVFALLRVAKPVLIVKGVAIVTRYRDVVEVLTSDGDFSVSTYAPPMRAITGDFILGLDGGPQYERDISLLRLAFGQGDLPLVGEIVRKAAEELVAARAADGVLNVVSDLTNRVPARLVAQYFGVPGPEEDMLIRWARALFEEIFVNLKHDRVLTERATAAAEEIRPYLDHLITQRKAELADGQAARDDLLGRLVGQQTLGEKAFSDVEIRSNLIGLLVGCIPTTSKAAALAIDELLRRPRELAAAQQAAQSDDDELLSRYVREAMRFAPQAPGLFRVAQRDVRIARGTRHEASLDRGHVVFVATQSAMLDGEVIDEPDEFRVDRPEGDYLHYGAGMHTCIGQYVNRVQIPIIVKALLRRPGLCRAPGGPGELVMAGNFPDSLRVQFTPE